MLFTDVFLRQIRIRLDNDQTMIEKFLERIKIIISTVFRKSLLPVIPQDEEFSVSGFAIRLQQQLKNQISALKLSELEWRVLHSFSVEPVGSGLVGVSAGFAFDIDIPEQTEIPLFDFKISKFDLSGKFIDSSGKTHTDLLRLDIGNEINPFLSEKMQATALS